MRMRLGAATLAACVIASAHHAEAALIMSLDSLFTLTSPDAIAVDQAPAGAPTVLGNSTVGDLSATPGFVLETSSSADAFPFLFTVSGQLTTTPSGLALFGTFDNLLASPAIFNIILTATDIVAEGDRLIAELSSTVVGAGGSVSATGFIDPVNTQFGIGGSPIAPLLLTAPVGTGLQSSIASDPFGPLAAPFSFTNQLSLTLGANGRATVNFFIHTERAAVASEPASLALLALGLLPLAHQILRRRRRD